MEEDTLDSLIQVLGTSVSKSIDDDVRLPWLPVSQPQPTTQQAQPAGDEGMRDMDEQPSPVVHNVETVEPSDVVDRNAEPIDPVRDGAEHESGLDITPQNTPVADADPFAIPLPTYQQQNEVVAPSGSESDDAIEVTSQTVGDSVYEASDIPVPQMDSVREVPMPSIAAISRESEGAEIPIPLPSERGMNQESIDIPVPVGLGTRVATMTSPAGTNTNAPPLPVAERMQRAFPEPAEMFTQSAENITDRLREDMETSLAQVYAMVTTRIDDAVADALQLYDRRF